ncbi:DUF3617 domain-containing protein [Massilia sp. RP-1-19]|uniref:DUF3617 domain-containing protein n=2 Tax=Massilia polaris TaxID=2728846 RepID=A0A848HKX1_9BURK|nr:DUF3617 domain-containing protein [Massilia polaris]
MPVRLTALAVISSAIFIALPCSAQNMKPGLWEINNKMQSSNGQLEQAMAMVHEQMAQMTPEQRKQMQDMMAKNGMQMPTVGAGGSMSVKMCMTREMAAANTMPMQEVGNCTHKRSAVVGNTMKVSFRCSKPDANGDGQVTFNSDSDYSMKMKVTTSASGKPETMNMDASGRWLGVDCGDIKPTAIPKAK